MDRRGATKMDMVRKILIRSAKLFILGVFVVNDSDSWQSLRIPGVLQVPERGRQVPILRINVILYLF